MERDEALDGLIQRADVDALVRLVDERTAAGDWSGLRRARDRSRSAVATGRQLWPVATLAEYRLALLAPPEWAAPMIADDAGLFTIGPLTEVVAQNHTWGELEPHLQSVPGAGLVAHERLLRGESIDPATVAGLPDVLELAYELAPWEPAYTLATYGDDGIDTPSPSAPSADPISTLPDGTAPGAAVDPDIELAVRELVQPWTASSNGHAEVVAVDGPAARAVRRLGVARAAVTTIPLGGALSWMAWAGASGGAHGRRRGAASGRFGALWMLTALAGRTADWPLTLDELGRCADAITWYWWDAGEPATGWRLQLAATNGRSGTSWAISARDDA